MTSDSQVHLLEDERQTEVSQSSDEACMDTAQPREQPVDKVCLACITVA